MINWLSPQDPFWAELLKGFGLPYKFIVGLSMHVDDASAKIVVRQVPLDEGGKPFVFDEEFIETRYTINYRENNRNKNKNASTDLVNIFRPRFGLPAHVVSFRVELYQNMMPLITCEFEPEPFTDPTLGDGRHIREALAPFQLTKN